NNDSVTQESLVVYPGKSNTTREYQVYIAKPNHQFINTGNKKYPVVHAIGILLATSLNCNMYPILPPGFSFCVIDAKGNVLIHSDSRRNLSENLLDELRGNASLVRAINTKSEAMIRDQSIYGTHQDLYVRPLKGQPLSLVVLFNKRSIMN